MLHELVVKIEAISKKDKTDFARYPVSNDHVNHFYVDRFGSIEVDLENFIKRFEVIERRLSFAAQTLYNISGDEGPTDQTSDIFK